MRKISVVFYCTLILIVVSCHSCKGSKQKKDAVSVNDSIINQVKVDSSSKLKVDTIVGPGEKNDFISSKMEIPFTTDEKKTVTKEDFNGEKVIKISFGKKQHVLIEAI